MHLRTLYVDMVSDPGDPKADASASLLSADAERVLIAEILGADVHETLHHVVRFETVDQDEAAIDELMEGFYHDLAPDEYPDEGKA